MIEVKVIGIDPKTNKLKLSHRVLIPQPEGWTEPGAVPASAAIARAAVLSTRSRTLRVRIAATEIISVLFGNFGRNIVQCL